VVISQEQKAINKYFNNINFFSLYKKMKKNIDSRERKKEREVKKKQRI